MKIGKIILKPIDLAMFVILMLSLFSLAAIDASTEELNIPGSFIGPFTVFVIYFYVFSVIIKRKE